MAADQDNTNYSSQDWQLDKFQRVKLRGPLQNDKAIKEVYSWVLNKKEGNHGKRKMEHQRSCGNTELSLQIVVSWGFVS